MIFNVSPTVKYIGTDDADLDLFESQYPTPGGMCYNSYVIFDEKIVIMDTVDARRVDEWKENLLTALEGKQPDYLVVQHMEPDHSGAVADVLATFPNLKVVASAKGLKFITQFFEHSNIEGRTVAVKDGSTLNIGSRTLHFITAPMVHWPEVIMTYDDKDKIMFTADGFGRFGLYNSGIEGDWLEDARRYYINICGKYGSFVIKALEKVSQFDVQIACALHGHVLQGDDLAEMIRLYTIWGSYGVETDGVLVAHASIHGGTAAVAERFAEILRTKTDKPVVVADLCRGDMSEAVAQAFRMGTLVLAASSYDADVFPPMHYFLHKLGLKNYQNRRVGIIESMTWAATAGRCMKKMIEPLKNVEIIEPTVTIESRLHDSDEAVLANFADAVLA